MGRELIPLDPPAFVTMTTDGRPRHPAARATPYIAPADRLRRAEGPVPASSVQLRRLSRRWQRARPAARHQAEGLRHRHFRAPVPDQEDLPELLDRRQALPA